MQVDPAQVSNRQSEIVHVGPVCEYRWMSGTGTRWQCCFCGGSIDDVGLDPCLITIFDPEVSPDSNRPTQHFRAHVSCLQSRMDPAVAKYATDFDPDWEAFIQPDED